MVTAMTLTTPLTELLDIRHPVLLAPMEKVSGGALAAAVSNAGGLGLIGGGYGDAEWLEAEFARAGAARVGPGAGRGSWAGAGSGCVGLRVIAGMAVHTMYIVADTAFIGSLGTDELAAATFVAPLFFLMIALTMGLGTAVTALVAQSVGRGDSQGADAAAIDAKYKTPWMEAADCVVCHRIIDPVAGLFQDFYNEEGHFKPRMDGWFQDMFGPGLEGEDLPKDEKWRSLQWLASRTVKDPRFAVAMTEPVLYLLDGRKALRPPPGIEDAVFAPRRRAYQMQLIFL